MTSCGYDVVEVQNGAEAMEQLRNPENKFDLVLLDLIMPQMDGFEVLTLMQEEERLTDIPVVVMSGNDS